jgi:hypothetical protein
MKGFIMKRYKLLILLILLCFFAGVSIYIIINNTTQFNKIIDETTVINDDETIIINDKFGLYNQRNAENEIREVDLVQLKKEAIQKVLLKDIILYKKHSDFLLLITRDNEKWALDLEKGVLYDEIKNNNSLVDEFNKGFDFEDLYLNKTYELWLNPPSYPTCFFQENGVCFRITYNTYINEYYLQYKRNNIYSPVIKAARYIKVRPSCMCIIQSNGKRDFSFFDNNKADMFDKELSDMSTYYDVSKMKFKNMKVTDEYNW